MGQVVENIFVNWEEPLRNGLQGRKTSKGQESANRNKGGYDKN